MLGDSLDVRLIRLDALRCVKSSEDIENRTREKKKKQDTQAHAHTGGKIPGNPRAISLQNQKISFFIKIL